LSVYCLDVFVFICFDINSYLRSSFHLLSLFKYQNQPSGYCLTVYVSQFSAVVLFGYVIQFISFGACWIKISYQSILLSVM